ncbi:YheV family putative zinc ribbon protein [Pseudomonas sp.]|uniref:YheV family putative zinc ribbon protein n=1 Tax=Pseudomonas sp. TaxID=306 RepID=UPI0039829851
MAGGSQSRSDALVNISAKRFIAGAVCPACSQMDKIQIWNVDGVPNRECVACGYADTPDERGNSVPRELPTRVNISALKPKVAAPKVQVVQFFPNPKLEK